MTMFMKPKDVGTMMNDSEKAKRIKCTMWKSMFKVDSKYVPVELVGKGSYGVVCSSINKKTNEKVAIKKITNVFEDDVEAIRALRELKILRHVRHENIIALKDVVIASSRSTFNDIYLVYELMDTDLEKIIKSNLSLTAEQLLYFMFQLLRGLNYLHSTKIIHRDLKPANLLLNANGDLKICDFGLARTFQWSGQPMTEYVVTRWYRAPELLLYCDNYGPSVDIWSVGCIFAELLGRKPIFCGENCLDQLRKIISILGTPHDSDLEFIINPREVNFIKTLPYRPAIDLQSLFPEADPVAVDLLRKMLVFNPKQRITVSEALKHPYFEQVYDTELLGPAPIPYDVNMDGNIGVDTIRKLMWNEMLLYHPEAPYLC